ncbi:MAG: DNA-3-methyladenine glycosylase 2 family protein [Rhodothermales bacterium]|nr:DNA-3-methyladenine glycosylase 2 family protein [Rhodothermales bacterium]
MSNLPYDTDQAVRHLRAADDRMAFAIEVVGPFSGAYRPAASPFEALSEAIAYQQLSGKAAATIFGRFRALLADPERLDPPSVLALSVEQMRSAGLSGAKTKAIRDLADKVLDGTVPEGDALQVLPDDEVIERLTVVHGIGPWTAKMFMMTRLGRPDVLAQGDLGIRKGVQRLDGLGELPTPAAVVQRAEPWQPYRSMASWYLWRLLDLDGDAMIIPGD